MPRDYKNSNTRINELILSIFIGIIYIYVLAKLSIWNLISVIILLLISKSFTGRLFSRLKTISFEVTNIKVKISETIIESFQGLRFFHSSGLIKDIDNQLSKETNSLEKSLKSRGKKLSLITPLLEALPILIISLVCLFAFLTIETNALVPTLAVFALALQRLNYKIITISQAVSLLVDNISNVSRLDKIISSKDKDFRRTGGRKLFFPIERISFSDVYFKYSKKDSFGLKNINFDLNLGKVTAIVGPSGSGKSSLVDLLIGLYEPNEGEIILNGRININKINLNSWQKNISIVHQDTFLFNNKIIDNLKFGYPNTTFNQIKKACQASGAYEFIEKLPKGYETIIGERGLKLSGGQRQRISIARH